jgi:HSP20 family protein
MPNRTRPASLSRRLSERTRAANAHAPDGRAKPGSFADAASDLLTRLKDVFDQLAETAGDHTRAESGDIPFSLGGKNGRMVFGYNIRMGLDGLQAEPFGDMPDKPARSRGRTAANPTPASRAPLVDVFEEAESLRIVAELPGVDAPDIVCVLEGADLLIESKGGHRYEKRLTLPYAVDPASLRHSCRNGILEIHLHRAPAQ